IAQADAATAVAGQLEVGSHLARFECHRVASDCVQRNSGIYNGFNGIVQARGGYAGLTVQANDRRSVIRLAGLCAKFLAFAVVCSALLVGGVLALATSEFGRARLETAARAA